MSAFPFSNRVIEKLFFYFQTSCENLEYHKMLYISNIQNMLIWCFLPLTEKYLCP